MILVSQKCVFYKKGLGYKFSNNEKYFKNYFVKESCDAPNPWGLFFFFRHCPSLS